MNASPRYVVWRRLSNLRKYMFAYEVVDTHTMRLVELYHSERKAGYLAEALNRRAALEPAGEQQHEHDD
jgi:hypothetical protein